MTTPTERARAFLRRGQSPDGGWGYRAGAPSMSEPTALALLALRDTGDPAARAGAFLVAAQHPDGGWGVSPEDGLSQWHTSWATIALAYATPGHPALPAALDWLRASAGFTETDPARRREFERLFDIDLALRGWPYGPGQAAWVEPTALALLALGAAGEGGEAARIVEGVRYLRDRRCAAGGWNVGNPAMFDKPLEPRAYQTALVLLALRPALEAEEADIRDGIAALRRQMAAEQGAMTLAWGLLALRVWDQAGTAGADALLAQQRPDGSWEGNPFVTAAALLALEAGWPGGRP
ncbi:MAG: terpene cyclase/mutase family protein [Ardenticatenaceae bacterium]|nr:terpene cyclase/mutase family protein [Ardenticatenaceae bacterium]